MAAQAPDQDAVDHPQDDAPPAHRERVRPRRLEADTTSYLKEVVESLRPNQDDDLTEQDVHAMLWNVLEELAPRAASASSDRHAAELVEALLPRMTDAQMRFLLDKMRGYFSHLWTNRYSSHVLQQILARASAIVDRELHGMHVEHEDDEDDEQEQEHVTDTPSMAVIIVDMTEEVETEWLSLMRDTSASHVLRSVLAVLAGRPPVIEKRGKNAKHRELAVATSFANTDTTATFSTPTTFFEVLTRIVECMTHARIEELHGLVFDFNSGPLVCAALQLLDNSLGRDLVERVLQWNNNAASVQFVYDFAGDAVASHFLEALFVSVDDEFFETVFRRCLQGRLLEFAEHGIANYVVQHAITRICTAELATEALQELEPSISTLLSMRRPGVVLRLVEMCRRLNMHEREIVEALSEAIDQQESKKPEAVRKTLVPALLAMELVTSTSNTNANAASKNSTRAPKVHLDVVGAKIVGELLQFEYSSWLETVYRGILAFNPAQLLALAMDSTGSRCVIEPIWETEDAERAWVRVELFHKFEGHFGSLALDRLGAFSVMKCYDKMTLEHKAVIANELVQVEGKLSGSHFATLVINAVHLSEFKRGRTQWEALYTKKDKVASLFEDMVKDDDDDDHNIKKHKKGHKLSKTTLETGDETKHKKSNKSKGIRTRSKHKNPDDIDANNDIAVIMGALGQSRDAGTKHKSKKRKKHNE